MIIIITFIIALHTILIVHLYKTLLSKENLRLVEYTDLKMRIEANNDHVQQLTQQIYKLENIIHNIKKTVDDIEKTKAELAASEKLVTKLRTKKLKDA